MDEIKPYHVVFDLILLVLAWIPVILLTNFATPRQRGFFCDDDTIRYPYHSSTVTPAVLYGVGYGVPIALILLTELYRTFLHDKRIQGYAVRPAHHLVQRPIPPYISRIYMYIGYFIIGGAFTSVIHNVAKYTIGRLRPHFFDVCRPNIHEPSVWALCNTSQYVLNFTCTGTDDYLIHDARLSFPSGHAAVSVYTMLFAVLYVEARADFLRSISQMTRPLLQLMLLSFAVATSLSRISDFKHHPFDVIAGAVLGCTVAVVLGLRVLMILNPVAWALAGSPNSKKTDDVTTAHLIANPMERQHEAAVLTGYNREVPYMDEAQGFEMGSASGGTSITGTPAHSPQRQNLIHSGI